MTKNKKTLIRIVSGACLLFTLLLYVRTVSKPSLLEALAFFLVYFLVGYDIVLKAVGGIVRGQIFDENFLMVLATVGAFGTKQYPEAVMVMLLYQIGELFQRCAVERSRRSISELMNLQADKAVVLRSDQYIEITPEDVQVGETILVRPGERVPLDGMIIKGESMIDTSALTGEAMPKFGRTGDQVLSGSIVSTGALEVRVEKEFYHSTVSKILDMVENASAKKAKTERFITKFAHYYTPCVVIVALVMGIIPPLFDADWAGWISKAMNFLVISCPCALVISVPMSFFMGIGAASKEGVLVKGGHYMELLSKADTFVFDKTGTLTQGKFAVVDVMPIACKEEILQVAAIAEQKSLHPIAACIVEAAGITFDNSWDIKEKAGYGVEAKRDNETILAGSCRFLQENSIAVTEYLEADTVVYVARNGAFLGYIVIADAVKEESAEALRTLREQGAKIIMLTGDRCDTAAAIAAELGIDHFEAELLPGDKVSYVERILDEKRKGEVLAFVGDGINDAPVLMRADLGIAMGGIGSDAAIEAADIVLMHDRLSAIGTAQKIAKKTMRVVMENIVFAIGIKLLVLGLTPFGLVSIWLAIFADVGVAVLAIFNAMRAGR